MVTIRKRTYTSRNNYQDVFTRIRLDVESVETLINPNLGSVTVDTNKPWVGKMNSTDGTFEAIQTNSSILPFRFFEGNFYDIFIHGEVSVDEDKTVVDVEFKLGWFYALIFLMVYVFPIILTIQFISKGDWDGIKNLTFWFLAFDLIPTLLLIVQLNRVDNKVADLLRAE